MAEQTEATPSSRAHRLLPMAGRDPGERHRVASSLELLFDLTVVVAFSAASNELAHAIVNGYLASGLIGFALAMFATCWAWINFSWFASAFDTDDWLYRLLTMVQMIGVLIVALGIPPMMDSIEHAEHLDLTALVIGYVVMRVAMLVQWLRAARQSPENRRACLSYVVAILIAQVGWVALIFVDVSLGLLLCCVVVLALVEGAGPVIAERRRSTPWHPDHIAERYSLLAIISLGEGVVGTVAALGAVVQADHGWSWQVALIGLAGIGLTFGMWWFYFTLPSGEALQIAGAEKSFVWGYGQILVFGSIVATGAGLHVAALTIENAEHHLSPVGAVVAVAVPLAVFTASLYLLYTYLVGTFERFHAVLLIGTAVFLALPVVLAAVGVPLPVCLVLLLLAPTVTVVGYETVGHSAQQAVLDRLRRSRTTRPVG